MQNIVSRCQHQCTRRIPGTFRIRPTTSTTANANSSIDSCSPCSSRSASTSVSSSFCESESLGGSHSSVQTIHTLPTRPNSTQPLHTATRTVAPSTHTLNVTAHPLHTSTHTPHHHPISPASAAHGRFFSVCRRTMAPNLYRHNMVMLPFKQGSGGSGSGSLYSKSSGGSGAGQSKTSSGSGSGNGSGSAALQSKSSGGRSGGILYTAPPTFKKTKKPYLGQVPKQGVNRSVGVSAGVSSGTGVANGSGQAGVGVGTGEETGIVEGDERAEGSRKVMTRARPPLVEIVAPGEMVAFWTTCMWLLRHTAHQFGYRLMPDGFVPVTDMLRYEGLGHVTPGEFLERIRRDPQDRFEMTVLPEYIGGVAHERWWVRARWGHSIPGVSYQSKRILNSSKLTNVVYIGSMAEWETIRKRGLEVGSFNDSLIPLSQQKESDVITGSIPKQASLLCIRINADEAMRKGVMFFHDVDTRLVSTGNGDGVIPPSVFIGAIELEVRKEVLSGGGGV